ncbi:hypothetical protein [Fundidesulfovibrio terrae]|uniref:hypothetical protein n=1 Tax=Fundidesulfovibrio terrae TaxID=2922866 RepID=UPI001FAF0366|nr:hypothetical protein [Fundidesulfovibrio terrae]
MADDYADNLAESFIRTNDGKGDTMGENFNGGVVAMPLAAGEVRAPLSGEVRDTVTNRRLGEDPLFTAMAGDSKEFVGGIPKELWDQFSPKQKESLAPTPTKEAINTARIIGAGVGGTAGTIIGGAAGAVTANPVIISGSAAFGAGAGAEIGVQAAEERMTSPPPAMSRAELYDRYKYAKEHD